MSDAIGTLASIWRFPVKSLQGESIDSVELSPLGIDFDRRWGFRDVESGMILSAKKADVGERLLSWSAVTDGDDIRVEIDGQSFSVSTDRVAIDIRCSKLLGREVRLEPATGADELYESYWPEMEGLALSDVTVEFPLAMMTEKGTFVDLAALHFVTSSSMRHLQQLAPDSRIEVGRFRPSFVIDLEHDVDGFVENDWQNRTARLGDVEFALGTASPRCVMTTKAQPGLPGDPAVFKTLARENRIEMEGLGEYACLGMYAEVTEPGRIAVGDPFRVL